MPRPNKRPVEVVEDDNKVQTEEVVVNEFKDDEDLPEPKQTSEQPVFHPGMVSAHLKRFFEYLLTLPYAPHLDDASELIEFGDITDSELSKICGVPVDFSLEGPVAVEGLREVLWFEMAEIDLSLPTDSCGWIVELLGGRMRYDEETEVQLAILEAEISKAEEEAKSNVLRPTLKVFNNEEEKPRKKKKKAIPTPEAVY
jgi:hypothetical protein